MCLVELVNAQGWHYIKVLREFHMHLTVSITSFACLIPPNPAGKKKKKSPFFLLGIETLR